MIESAAAASLAGVTAVAPYDPGSPCEILVDFNTSDHVEKYRYRAGVEITGSRQIASRETTGGPPGGSSSSELASQPHSLRIVRHTSPTLVWRRATARGALVAH